MNTLELDIEERETLNSGRRNITTKSDHIKTKYCCELISKKFEIITLILLILILGLQVFKIIYPALSEETKKEVSESILRNIKKLTSKIFNETNLEKNTTMITENNTNEEQVENKNFEELNNSSNFNINDKIMKNNEIEENIII